MPLRQKHGAHGFGARQAIGHIALMLPDGAAELLKSQIVVIKFKQSVKPIHTHHPLPVISFGVILRQCLHGHDGTFRGFTRQSEPKSRLKCRLSRHLETYKREPRLGIVYPVFLSCRRGFDQGGGLDFKPLFECLARDNAEIHRLYVTGID